MEESRKWRWTVVDICHNIWKETNVFLRLICYVISISLWTETCGAGGCTSCLPLESRQAYDIAHSKYLRVCSCCYKVFRSFFFGGGEGDRRPLTPQNIAKFMLAYATSLRHFICQFTWPGRHSFQRFLTNFFLNRFLTFLTRVNKFLILIIKEPKIRTIFGDWISFQLQLNGCLTVVFCVVDFFSVLFSQRYSGLVLHYPVSHARRIRFIGLQGTRQTWKCYVVNEVVFESKHNENVVFTNCLQGKR